MNAKLGVEEVVKLIEACKNAGVTKLKFDKLELQFSQVTTVVQDSAQARAVHPKEVENLSRHDEYIQDLEIENLMITDALAFEDQLGKAAYAAQSHGPQRYVLEE